MTWLDIERSDKALQRCQSSGVAEETREVQTDCLALCAPMRVSMRVKEKGVLAGPLSAVRVVVPRTYIVVPP